MLGGEIDEALADVHAQDLHPQPGQGMGVATWPAPDVEDSHPGLEAQGADEELDFLVGALREGVAEVGGAQVIGNRLEPVVGGHP